MEGVNIQCRDFGDKVVHDYSDEIDVSDSVKPEKNNSKVECAESEIEPVVKNDIDDATSRDLEGLVGDFIDKEDTQIDGDDPEIIEDENCITVDESSSGGVEGKNEQIKSKKDAPVVEISDGELQDDTKIESENEIKEVPYKSAASSSYKRRSTKKKKAAPVVEISDGELEGDIEIVSGSEIEDYESAASCSYKTRSSKKKKVTKKAIKQEIKSEPGPSGVQNIKSEMKREIKDDPDYLARIEQLEIKYSIKREIKSEIKDEKKKCLGVSFIEFSDKPYGRGYKEAIRRNELRYEHQIKNNEPIPELSYHEMKKLREARSPEEKAKEAKENLIEDLELAYNVLKITKFMLKYSTQEKFDEKKIIRCLKRFLYSMVTPTSLCYAPHFLHTIIYIRGCTEFSIEVRKLAEQCYLRCHCMFPLLPRQTFEEAFKVEMKRVLPEGFDGLYDEVLEHEEYDFSSDDDE